MACPGTGWNGRAAGGYRPIALIVAALLFCAMVLLPVPRSLIGLVEQADPPGYNLSGANTETIVDSVNFHKNPEAFEAGLESGGPGEPANGLESSEDVARRAMIMVAILVVAALL
jgi:hypothetical protein